jgi:hypothetical protein
VKATERAARAHLRTLPPELAAGPLARAVIDLARRLDDGPADTAAVLLVRELRLALQDLRSQAKDDATHDVEAFLARVSTSAFDAGH